MNSGVQENYFEVLGLKIEDLESLDEATILKCVNKAYKDSYDALNIMPNNPRFKGKDRGFWQPLFVEAKDTLLVPEKRRAHIEDLRTPYPTPDPATTPATSPAPALPRVIAKFPNGDEATSIPELALLMIVHFEFAKDALYRGSLATGLDGAGELHFANVAREAVQEYPDNQDVGLMALVQILEGKISFGTGGDAETPRELASLIDQNWEVGKKFLYNGFIAFWLKYVNEENLADTANRITNRYAEEKDMGLEFFVQRLDPHIGSPVPKTNHTSINFGTVDTETKKTIRLEIENTGRGFLYGDVELASEMSGFRVSSPPIRGRAVVTVELDASPLTVKRTHKTELIIKTNGGELTVPISCYVDYATEKSIRRVVISSLSMGAIALVVRWIVLQLGGFRFSWLTSAKFVDLESFDNKWGEWPLLEVELYAPDFAGIGFVIAFAALGTGIFFVFWKRRPG